MVEIAPEEPYSDEYNEVVDRFKNERDNHILPALRTKVENMDDYDTLIIGSPIWGGLLSSPVKSFLSGYDLKKWLSEAGFSVELNYARLIVLILK